MYTFFVAHQIFLCVSSLGFVKVILIDQHSTGLINIPAFIEKGLLASILHTYIHIPKTMGLSYIIFNLSTQTYLPPIPGLKQGSRSVHQPSPFCSFDFILPKPFSKSRPNQSPQVVFLPNLLSPELSKGVHRPKSHFKNMKDQTSVFCIKPTSPVEMFVNRNYLNKPQCRTNLKSSY